MHTQPLHALDPRATRSSVGLAEHFHTVNACPGRTNYARILDGPDRMPAPSDGTEFTVYTRK